jgi:competence protein ComEA
MKRAVLIATSLGLCLALSIWVASSNRSVLAQQATAGSSNGQPDPIASMPNAPGKDITVQTCTKCHSITNITSQNQDMDGWTAIINKMVGYGATGTDEDLQQVLDYLVKYYGPVSQPARGANTPHPKIMVNKDTAAQLATELGLTDEESKAVVAYRDKNGNFKSIDDLKKVPKVDSKKIDAHASDLVF